MIELSQEIINIAGKDYTLFLNRKGIIAWEKYANEERIKVQQATKDLYTSKGDAPIEKGTNPFDNLEDKGNESSQALSMSYRKLFWIMLYENHKLDFEDANKLYDKAIEEYGEAQLIALGAQMVNDMNEDKDGEKPTKKLPALRPSEK